MVKPDLRAKELVREYYRLIFGHSDMPTQGGDYRITVGTVDDIVQLLIDNTYGKKREYWMDVKVELKKL